ncbi:hypothetical protein VHUM_01372 [Vanrija humicola]|uniref:Endoplasmic oxidoreductin 1 n=1 Tax=Vanrija humicola TaxID=5417 RepID=A0A7D8YYB0_VANHU|nr:hypothetical protein VHUM_01372 [Vanrija humicola]
MVSFSGLLSSLPLLGGAVAGILDPSRPDSKVARNVLEGKAEGYCSPSGPIEHTSCAYETIEQVNTELFPKIHELVEHPFFRYYKVDLFRECPFWQENGFCMNRACSVEETEESEIPEKWRSAALSAVTVSSAEDGPSSCYFRDDDFCFIEDDSTPEGQYIDLALNPERFTGYAGDSSHAVWRAIYKENCFGLSEAGFASSAAGRGGKGAKEVLASAVVGAGGISTPNDNETCEEKKLYYRVISGLHASISIHICAEYLDTTTGEWKPNLQCFVNRLATHPERLSNVYFNAVLVLRAIARAAPYFRAYDVGVTPRATLGKESCSTAAGDKATRSLLDNVLSIAERSDIASGFDEAAFFQGPDAPILKEQFKTHFRNVSRIMDCVGCDKCRLWGKLQVSGIGTALKILFALDDKALDPKRNPDLLQRSEVVALFNTLHRISESLNSVEDFRQIYAATQAAEAEVARQRRAEEEEARRAAERSSLSYYLSPSAIFATILSILEAIRRSCRGCVEFCVRSLQTGPVANVLNAIRQAIGGDGVKTEL